MKLSTLQLILAIDRLASAAVLLRDNSCPATYTPTPGWPQGSTTTVCYDTSYYKAGDQGQIQDGGSAKQVVQQKCEALCTPDASCQAFVGAIQYAADSNLATGVCYFYNHIPSPRRCTDSSKRAVVAENKVLSCSSTTTSSATTRSTLSPTTTSSTPSTTKSTTSTTKTTSSSTTSSTTSSSTTSSSTARSTTTSSSSTTSSSTTSSSTTSSSTTSSSTTSSSTTSSSTTSSTTTSSAPVVTASCTPSLRCSSGGYRYQHYCQQIIAPGGSGNNANTPVPAASSDACEAVCDNDQTCTGWSYTYTTGICTTYSPLNDPTTQYDPQGQWAQYEQGDCPIQ